MPIDESRFRGVMGRFATGVAIVTSRDGDSVRGTTMNAFCSVSLAPPLVLVCVERTTSSHRVIAAGRVFAVNILKTGQQDLARVLSQKGTAALEAAHRLEGIPFVTKMTGAPILLESQGYLDCRVVQAVEAGDHTIYIGLVEDAGWDAEDAPLVYFRSTYGGFAPDGSG